MQPDKCEFLRPELEYLGHVISPEGVKPNPDNLTAVRNFKRPVTIKEVQSFLGLCGYYRKFVKNFAFKAKALTNLIKKDQHFVWTVECKNSFQKLKNDLCSPPVLRYPNYKKMFTLTTDASNVGLGAILSQDGHPCCYISRPLNDAEVNYTTTEKEMLAVVWSIKRLRQYLLGRHFLIQTDHQALKWVMNVKDPCSRIIRWRLRLEEYKKGCENKAADCMSRIFHTKSNEDELEKLALQLEEALPDIPIDRQLTNTPVNNPDNALPDLLINNNELEPVQELGEEFADLPKALQWYPRYCQWLNNSTNDRTILKHNADSKFWVKLIKNELRKEEGCIMVPPYDEEPWVEKLVIISIL